MALEAVSLDSDGLKAKAKRIRELIIKITTEAGSGHPSSSLSATEVVAALHFGGFLKLDPEAPRDADRDRFILSKGHAVPVLYAALCERGYFTEEQIMTLRKLNSPFEGHPNAAKLPGMEASTGSLGQGLSIGLGMALGMKADGKDNHVYVLMGDGEVDEGQVWEAMAAADKYNCGNLVAIIDVNGYQQTGATDAVLDMGPLAKKCEAFGWHTLEIQGNDMDEVMEALKAAKAETGRPTCIVSHTKKGAGIVPLMEKWGDTNMHGQPLPADKAKEALEYLAKA
ncbi:transketolase [Alienimonas chondri]|uniref:Transketolase 2 n=1 Tax=Alienimonas chondri TaxID=2681879 RepID=A0ABX1VGY1_9PLAN|nr:transketolase [Alienimonas chondri]NNJ26765.1 Transketolase 2 [Alienimonas chondri]